MSLLIGVVGKPNAGKSTFFSSLTLVDAKIASYPFTTIQPNRGVGYVRKPCPHIELGRQCNPRDSFCRNGIRYIPVQLLDVAGIVPDAHRGRGLGLQFLDDLRQADALIQVVDGSGKSDLEGNPTEDASPEKEVEFLENEMAHWVASILKRNLEKFRKKDSGALYDVLSSLKLSQAKIDELLQQMQLQESITQWKEEEIFAFSKKIAETKPIIIAANKADRGTEKIKKMKERLKGRIVIPCSAAFELALRKADRAGIVSYLPGAADFEIKGGNMQQQEALKKIKDFMRENGSTGVQYVLESAVFDVLQHIAVYPVEDESRWSDSKGNVLPNVMLLPRHSTPLQLAERVHTDLAKNFIAAFDARKKRQIGKDYILNDNDVIKIFAGR